MDDWTPDCSPAPQPRPLDGGLGGRRIAEARIGTGALQGAPWKALEVPPDLSRHGLHVGTSGFHYEDWAGAFYPPRGLRPDGAPGMGGKEWFPFYQMYFSFLEVNHTFLREPDIAHFVELDRRCRASMRFSVLVHRDVSHKGTWDPEEGKSQMRRHAAAVAPIAESGRFYSFLIQLDHRQERSRKVLDYLLLSASAALAEGLDVHVEFRDRTWHQEPVLKALKDAGIGICNTDLPALPRAFPLRSYATTAKGYVRYNGRNAAAWHEEPFGRRPGDGVRSGRYDYLYSLEEIEERIPAQLLLLEKTGAVAAVWRNHARGQSPMNAARNLFLAERRLRAAEA